MLQEGSSGIGYLTTVGRVSGRPHRVALRFVYYQSKFYTSRRDTASDWCKNLLRSPRVTVQLQGEAFQETAKLVDDDELARKISSLKYRDQRVHRRRVIVEIVPAGTLDPTLACPPCPRHGVKVFPPMSYRQVR